MMNKVKKNIFLGLLFMGVLFLTNTINATTISVSSNPKVGDNVKITVSVPNVNTVDLTANISGAGTSSSVRIVDGDLSGAAKTYSKSVTVRPTSAGVINISITGDSNAVLNGQYVNVSGSKSVTVIKPVVPPTPAATTPTKTTSTTPTKSTVVQKKSSDAKIVGLSLNVGTLSPKFTKNTTKYSIDVGNSVNKLGIKVKLSNNKATYKITGNKDFKLGENIVKIKVTAENRTTTKTYTIKVNKTPDLTLSSLTVSNAELMKEFDPNVLEYKLKDITEDIKKLDINAATTSDAATVKIAGNDSLVAGENVIKIVVSDESGKYTRVYTLTVNKIGAVPVISENVEDSEDVVEQDSLIEKITDFLGMRNEKIRQNITIVALYLLSLLEFIQVIYLYKQLKAVNPDFDKITRRGQVNKDVEPARRRAVDIDIDTESNPGVNLDDNKEK